MIKFNVAQVSEGWEVAIEEAEKLMPIHSPLWNAFIKAHGHIVIALSRHTIETWIFSNEDVQAALIALTATGMPKVACLPVSYIDMPYLYHANGDTLYIDEVKNRVDNVKNGNKPLPFCLAGGSKAIPTPENCFHYTVEGTPEQVEIIRRKLVGCSGAAYRYSPDQVYYK